MQFSWELREDRFQERDDMMKPSFRFGREGR
jgi:hypothetical protein